MRDTPSADHPPGPPPPTISVRAASLSFGDEILFDNLDFEVAGGCWTCVLGPSGVGKTSLLRMIAGLTPLSPGARIDCDDGLGLSGRVAYMAQQDLLLPWLTLLENVTLGVRLRHGRRGRHAPSGTGARAAELLDRVGLADRMNALPAACSGGMRQRAALVRTLVEDRPVVLMDEPFSALDAITRLRLQGLASELLARRTVLLVTHDPLEALRLGHHIHVMSGKPAVLDEALQPPGPPPRDPGDATLLARHAELLERLVSADTARPGDPS
jgi:putative hydroxymethylpyrimidine transport system ATP-binding protein